MDARVRWLQVRWPTTTTMLELPICLGIIGAMILVGANSFTLQQHLGVGTDPRWRCGRLTFSNRAGDLAGKVLTIRAWEGGDAGLPVAWSCGHAVVPPLTATAVDQTTLSEDELLSTCRGRR